VSVFFKYIVRQHYITADKTARNITAQQLHCLNKVTPRQSRLLLGWPHLGM